MSWIAVIAQRGQGRACERHRLTSPSRGRVASAAAAPAPARRSTARPCHAQPKVKRVTLPSGLMIAMPIPSKVEPIAAPSQTVLRRLPSRRRHRPASAARRPRSGARARACRGFSWRAPIARGSIRAARRCKDRPTSRAGRSMPSVGTKSGVASLSVNSDTRHAVSRSCAGLQVASRERPIAMRVAVVPADVDVAATVRGRQRTIGDGQRQAGLLDPAGHGRASRAATRAVRSAIVARITSSAVAASWRRARARARPIAKRRSAAPRFCRPCRSGRNCSRRRLRRQVRAGLGPVPPASGDTLRSLLRPRSGTGRCRWSLRALAAQRVRDGLRLSAPAGPCALAPVSPGAPLRAGRSGQARSPRRVLAVRAPSRPPCGPAGPCGRVVQARRSRRYRPSVPLARRVRAGPVRSRMRLQPVRAVPPRRHRLRHGSRRNSSS